MAGGNAVIKIDSFVGGALPPKAFIKSIHIIRDTFPAENHSAENDEIDIVTQAGVGALRGGLTSRVRDGALSGRNPFVDITAPERTSNFEGNLGGTIIPQKLSFSISGSGRRQFDTPIATYTTPLGKQSVLLGERPNNGWSMQGLVDYALTKDQALRLQYFHNDTARKNLGIGGFDLAERAYSNDSSGRSVPRAGSRADRTALLPQHAPAVPPTRTQQSHSVLEAPDHSRARWRHERRRAGVRRPAPERARHRLGPELRARASHHADRRRAQRPSRSHRRCDELPGDVRLHRQRLARRRHADQLHAPHRRSAHHLLDAPGRPATSRTTSGFART